MTEIKPTIAIAPSRISIFGGGTDVAPYCLEHEGAVLNLAINLRTEVVIYNAENIIEWGELQQAIVDRYDFDGQMTLTNRSYEGSGGLGGSASVAVATIGAIRHSLGLPIDRHEIAREAFEIETKTLGWHGGCQDQFAAAYGGFNYMEIGEDVVVRPIDRGKIEGFLPWMLLFDTEMPRKSFDVQTGFKKPTPEQIDALDQLVTTATEARFLFNRRAYHKIGDLLHNNWLLKKRSNKVSNEKLDAIYDRGLKLGASGGKVLGAGQGGHMLFVVNPKNREQFIENIGLKWVDFSPCWNGLEVRRI